MLPKKLMDIKENLEKESNLSVEDKEILTMLNMIDLTGQYVHPDFIKKKSFAATPLTCKYCGKNL